MRPILASILFFFAAIQISGQTLAGPEREVSLPALQAADGARDAAAASDGSGWLVAWTRTSLIAAARVDAEGNVNDPAGMIIATPDGGQVSHPAVAFGGNHYLVAWTTYRSMRARLIGADGELSPAVEIGTVSGGAGIAMAVHAASDGSHFLVAWSEWIAVGTYQRRAVVLDMNANAVASVTLNADESSVDFAISAGNGEFAIFDGLHGDRGRCHRACNRRLRAHGRSPVRAGPDAAVRPRNRRHPSTP